MHGALKGGATSWVPAVYTRWQQEAIAAAYRQDGCVGCAWQACIWTMYVFWLPRPLCFIVTLSQREARSAPVRCRQGQCVQGRKQCEERGCVTHPCGVTDACSMFFTW